MAKKNELVVGLAVSVIQGEEVVDGEIKEFLPGGKVRVSFPDRDDGNYSYADVDVVVVKPEDEESITITQTIKISKSDVTIDSRTMSDPKLMAAEELKQAEFAKRRRKTRLAKLKAPPKTPIQVRKAVLAARLRKVKARKPHNYRKEQLIVWAKEYELIKNRPDSWRPGCIRAKKKKTAQDFIDELQIDD